MNELELGYTKAEFEFPQIKAQWPASSGHKLFVERMDRRIDEFGNPITKNWQHPADMFDPDYQYRMNFQEAKTTIYWLLDKDEVDYMKNNGFKVYDVRLNHPVFKLTQHEIMHIAEKDIITNLKYNKSAYDKLDKILYERAKDALKWFSSKNPNNVLGLSPDFDIPECSQEAPIQVIYGVWLPDGSIIFRFKDCNWKRTFYNQSSNIKIFDWNTAVIRFTLNAHSLFLNPRIALSQTAKSYDNYKI